jgi:hypothetical protein
MKKNYRFIFFLFLLFLVIINIFITFDYPLLCEGDSEKFTGGEKVNTAVSGNNIHNNVNNPSVNIHNPEINIPSSVGTAIAQGASSIGIAGTTIAGIRAMSHRTGGMTPRDENSSYGFWWFSWRSCICIW